MRYSTLLLSICLIGIVPNAVNAEDWNRFRGPNGSGIVDSSDKIPTTWSPKENLAWRSDLPGPGVSSPIIVGDKIFVTCYSGYGLDRENIGDQKDLKRHVLCLDKKSGSKIWEKIIPSTVEEDYFEGMGVPEHGYASHTPVSDGQNVYVFLGKSGVYAYDLEGNEKWHVSVGTRSDDRQWGSSSSPIVYKDLVVVPAGPEGRAIVGLAKDTGKEIWKAPSEGLGSVWGTPAIVEGDEGGEIVIGAPSEIWALSPATGKLKWYCEFVDSDQFSSSVVVAKNVVYAIEGRGGGSIAVTAGGKGDVSSSRLLWKGRDNSRFASPIVYENRLYFVSNRIAHCLDADTHKEIFESRLRSEEPADPSADQDRKNPPEGRNRGGGGGFGNLDYSSPIIANGNIYFVARDGETFVFEAGNEFRQIAANRVTAEAEDFSATPAVSDGAIFIRSNRALYKISYPEK